MFTASIAFAAFFFIMIVARLPIGFAVGAVGFVGIVLIRGLPAAISTVGNEVLEAASYTFSVMPLFVLMGNFVTRGQLSRDLYRAAFAFFGHRRGGLAASTILASAGFGAVCGSSMATAATMSKVAVPEMRRLRYRDSLAAASVAAGGTLGILIPPSGIMVVYGILTETSIGALFAAGILPGILACALYLLATSWTIYRDPEAGPPGERTAWPGRFKALAGVWSVLLLFVAVMGGLYGGIVTATEASGLGAFGGLLIAWSRKSLSLPILRDVLVDSAKTTGMLITIVVGAQIFANFINFTSLPSDLRAFVLQFSADPIYVIVAICFVYILLGCIMESMSMLLLTIPVFFPLVISLGFDPVWFGILIVCVIEIGLITPPVGMNVFVIRAIMPEVPGNAIWRSLAPYITADVVRIAVLIAFPIISLYLPRLMKL